MSFPNIPDVSPAIDINREDVINLLLASIAFEELGLAHIINAEGEKIQCVTGTNCPGDIDDLIEVNLSVAGTLRNVIKTQMLLQFKLEDVLRIIDDENGNGNNNGPCITKQEVVKEEVKAEVKEAVKKKTKKKNTKKK